MKYLLLLLIVFAVLAIAKALRAPAARPREPRPPQPAVGQEDMPACAHCGMYLPRSEALPGRGGVFCSEAHRKAFEAQPPSP